jgi:ABC-type nitrate/sulfonate/bicarbonate transport system permease component
VVGPSHDYSLAIACQYFIVRSHPLKAALVPMQCLLQNVNPLSYIQLIFLCFDFAERDWELI